MPRPITVTDRGRSLKKKGAGHPSTRRTKSPRTNGDGLLDQSYQLAQAVEHSSELIGMADREGKFVFANSAFLQALGYSKEELLGKLFHTVLSANNPPTLAQDMGANMYEP